MRPSRFLPLLLLVLCPMFATAQIGLYAEGTAAKANVSGAEWVYGPTFGAYFDKGHLLFLATGIDARGAILGSGDNVLDSGLIGPRLALQPHVFPLQPYVEGLVGLGHVGYSQGTTPAVVNKFEYQFVGGLDLTILPRIDWRIVEFSYGGLSGLGSSFNPKTFSTGIVVRLP